MSLLLHMPSFFGCHARSFLLLSPTPTPPSFVFVAVPIIRFSLYFHPLLYFFLLFPWLLYFLHLTLETLWRLLHYRVTAKFANYNQKSPYCTGKMHYSRVISLLGQTQTSFSRSFFLKYETIFKRIVFL